MAANTNKTYKDILAYPYLSGYVSHYEPGMLAGLDLFNFGSARTSTTNKVNIMDKTFKTTSTVAAHVSPDAPAPAAKKATWGGKLIELFDIRRKVSFTGSELDFLDDMNALADPQIVDMIQDALDDQNTEIRQVVNDDCFDALDDGIITLTESDGGTYGTVDFSIPAGNAYTADIGWNDALAANIISDVATAKKTYEAATKDTLKTMIGSSAIIGYIMKNAGAKGYKDFTDLNTQYMNTGTIKRFMGLDVIEINSTYYKSASTQHIADTKVKLLGSRPNIFGAFKGYGRVPIPGSERYAKVQNEYSYPVLHKDAVKLDLISGVRVIPYLFKPECVAQISWTA